MEAQDFEDTAFFLYYKDSFDLRGIVLGIERVPVVVSEQTW